MMYYDYKKNLLDMVAYKYFLYTYMRVYKYIENTIPPLLGYFIANKVNQLCKSNFS